MGQYASIITAIDTAIENIVSGKYESQTISNRSYTVHNLDKLRQLRSYYARLESGSGGMSFTALKAGGPR